MSERAKKIIDIVSKVIVYGVIILAIVIVLFNLTGVGNKNGKGSFLGLRAYTVLSDSMSDTFTTDDLIICRALDGNDPEDFEHLVAEEDIISYVCNDKTSDAYGKVITHKIKNIEKKGDLYLFTTYGTTTGDVDSKKVEQNYVMGEYLFKITNGGRFLRWLKTPVGYSIVIGIPFLMLIAYQIYNTYVAYAAYKKEKNAETQGELDRLAKEKAELEARLAALEARAKTEPKEETKGDEEGDEN